MHIYFLKMLPLETITDRISVLFLIRLIRVVMISIGEVRSFSHLQGLVSDFYCSSESSVLNSFILIVWTV